MKSMRLIPLIAGVLAIGASSAAMAGGLNVGVNIGIPAPVYVVPAPVYAPPPPPVVYQPVPVVAAPVVVVGWHGDRYWDGRRYWGRDEWYRHHGGYDHDHEHWDNGRHNGWH